MMIEAALVLAQANVENGVATRTREFLDWGALPDLWVIFLVVVPAVLLFAVMIYRRERPTGGRVFHAGIIAGGWALSIDPKFQTLMRNVMARFGVWPESHST